MGVLHGFESDRSVGVLDVGVVKGVVGGGKGGFVLVVSVLGQELLLRFHLDRLGSLLYMEMLYVFFIRRKHFGTGWLL
jgi:hypothetical protein